MKALILAAGLGSRLGLDIPKPMYEINGKPILEHNLLLLQNHHVTDIVINVHYKPEVIKNYFKDGSKWDVRIQYSFEENLLGTSGAVKNLENFWNENPFFIIYGDNFSDINLSKMLQFHTEQKPIATIAIFNPKENLNSGIAGGTLNIDDKNNLLSFTEGSENKGIGYVNAGVYIVEPEILNYIPNGFSDFGKDIFPKLLNEKKIIKGYTTKSFVLAIDTMDALTNTKSKIHKEMK